MLYKISFSKYMYKRQQMITVTLPRNKLKPHNMKKSNLTLNKQNIQFAINNLQMNKITITNTSDKVICFQHHHKLSTYRKCPKNSQVAQVSRNLTILNLTGLIHLIC